VLTLAALFSLDAFAGGLVVNSLLALWLFERFGLSLTTTGVIFFWTGVLSALSYFAAAWIAERIAGPRRWAEGGLRPAPPGDVPQCARAGRDGPTLPSIARPCRRHPGGHSAVVAEPA
jgi:hypothetical protein